MITSRAADRQLAANSPSALAVCRRGEDRHQWGWCHQLTFSAFSVFPRTGENGKSKGIGKQSPPSSQQNFPQDEGLHSQRTTSEAMPWLWAVYAFTRAAAPELRLIYGHCLWHDSSSWKKPHVGSSISEHAVRLSSKDWKKRYMNRKTNAVMRATKAMVSSIHLQEGSEQQQCITQYISYYKHIPNNAQFHPNPQLFLIQLFCLLACWIWSHVCIAPPNFSTELWIFSHLASSFLDTDEGHTLHPAWHCSPALTRLKSLRSRWTEKDRWMMEGQVGHLPLHPCIGLLVHHCHNHECMQQCPSCSFTCKSNCAL